MKTKYVIQSTPCNMIVSLTTVATNYNKLNCLQNSKHYMYVCMTQTCVYVCITQTCTHADTYTHMHAHTHAHTHSMNPRHSPSTFGIDLTNVGAKMQYVLPSILSFFHDTHYAFMIECISAYEWSEYALHFKVHTYTSYERTIIYKPPD